MYSLCTITFIIISSGRSNRSNSINRSCITTRVQARTKKTWFRNVFETISSHTSMVKFRWSMQIKNTRADCCDVSAAFAQQDKELNEACWHASALESKWVHLDWVSPVTGQCMYANTAEDAYFGCSCIGCECEAVLRFMLMLVAVNGCRPAGQPVHWSGGEIIEGAWLQLWTTATPFQPPTPTIPPLCCQLPPPPSWEMEMGAFNVC